MTKSAKSATKQTKVVRLKAWEPIFQALLTCQQRCVGKYVG